MNDFRGDPRELLDEQILACRRVIESGWYVLGKEVKDFENQWASTCGSQGAVGVANGLDAIEIGLRSLRIRSGDEVITTPMTAFATVLGILRAGATPVMADIDPATGLLDRDSVLRCISPRTKAVLLVHLYGQVRYMTDWTRLCRDHGIQLLEDCAQSHLASEGDRHAGTFGRWGAYSFYPTKNLGAVGDAGALVSDDERVLESARAIRNYGQSSRYVHVTLGMNSRLDELQAAILCARLGWLARFTERRRHIAQKYYSLIKHPDIQLLAPPLSVENHVHHLFVVKCGQRDRLSDHLHQAGVQTLVHYPIAAHRQPACPDVRCDPVGLIHAERHAKECLSIPCHHNMSDEQVAAVISAVNSFDARAAL